jgi:hypothetical protein
LFPLEVKSQKKQWPEQGQRDLIWLPAQEAVELVRKPQLRRLIARFMRIKKRKLKAGQTV